MQSFFWCTFIHSKNRYLLYKNLLLKPIFEILAIAFFCLTAALPAMGQNLQLNIINAKSQKDSIIRNEKFTEITALQKALTQYKDSLKQAGYFDIKFGELKAKNDTIYNITADFGPQNADIHINFSDSYLEEYLTQLELAYKDNSFTISSKEVESLFYRFTKLEAQNGQPLTSFQLKNIIRQNNHLIADLVINREKKRSLDNIVIRGYEKFPNSYLENYAHIKKGEVYNEEKILAKTELLNNLPFVNQARSAEVLFTKDSTSLYLYLDKAGANNFDGLLGFRSDEETGRLRLDGYLNLQLINNLNYGERLDLQFKSDGNDQQALNIDLELPFLFRSPIGADFNLNLFRKDTTYSNIRQQLALFYQLNYKMRFTAGALYETSDILTQQEMVNTDIGDYKKTFISGGLSILQRSVIKFLPTLYQFKINAGIGHRNTNSGKSDQLLIEALSEYTFSITERFKIYTANTTKSLSSDTYFTNELFRFGGINSIRGFKENSINAHFYTAIRTEFAYIPNPSLYLHTIFDVAYFENKILQQEDLIYSLGLGTGLSTGAGILNINLANGIQKNNSFKFSNSILHISIISSF